MAGRVKLLGGHSLPYQLGVGVHKVYDAVVILGVFVVLAVALHHFKGVQVNLNGFYDSAVNPCRQHQRVFFKIVFR